MGGARSKASKGVVEFRPYVTRVPSSWCTNCLCR